MPTIDARTVSLSGSPPYSTLDAWEADSDVVYTSGLVSADVRWRGEIGAATDNFIGTNSTMLTVAGTTVDATRYKELVAGAGAAFRDNIGSGALRYNEANGCSIRSAKTYGAVISVSEGYFRIIDIQVQATGTSGRAIDGGVTGLRVDNCIIDATNNSAYVAFLGASGSVTSNTIITQRRDSAAAVVKLFGTASMNNCTIVVPHNLTDSTNAFTESSCSGTIKNCAVFGTQNVSDNTGLSYTTCFTEIATPPTGFTVTAYDTATGAMFENITDSTRDFRIKSGSSLIGAGVDEPTYAANDILGTPRPLGAYDVGAFQFPSLSTDLTALTFVNNPIFHAASIAVTLNLSASLVDDSDTFHTHTVNVGALALTANLFDDGDTFHAHTITLGGVTQNLTMPMHVEFPTFYSATINLSNTLTASLVDDSDTFHTHTVNVGALALTANLFDDGDTFHTHAISQSTGTQNLVASLFVNPNDFKTASINTSLDLAASTHIDDDTFYDAFLSLGDLTIFTPEIINQPIFHNSSISTSIDLSANVFDDADIFNGHSIVTSLDLTANKFDNQNAFHAHMIMQPGVTQNLVASLFVNQVQYHPAQISSVINLAAANYENSNTFFGHLLTVGPTVLTASMYTAEQIFHVHVLTGGGETLVPPSRTLFVPARNNILVV